MSLEVLTVLGIITVLAMTVWGWLTLPAVIPTHAGLSGTLDVHVGKGSLLILPLLSICLAVVLTFVSRFPHTYNYPWPITTENAPRQYSLARLLLRWMTVELVWMFCAQQWALIQAAQSHSAGFILLVTSVMVLALIVTIILYLRTAARAH